MLLTITRDVEAETVTLNWNDDLEHTLSVFAFDSLVNMLERFRDSDKTEACAAFDLDDAEDDD